MKFEFYDPLSKNVTVSLKPSELDELRLALLDATLANSPNSEKPLVDVEAVRAALAQEIAADEKYARENR